MPRTPRFSRVNASPSPPSSSFPRYTTFTPEELHDAFAHYRHIGAREGVDTGSSLSHRSGSRIRLIKSHECCVPYPDGTRGMCRYTRGGPTWHVFGFSHEGKQTAQPLKSQLPTRNVSERMENTLAAIEAKAAEVAPFAFAQAIIRERDERFKRATVPRGFNRYESQKDITPCLIPRPQMSAKRAKEMAGKYALCLCIGSGDSLRFIPCTGVNNQNVYDSLADVNEAWQQCPNRSRRFVACLCRYSRQWELPVYNPLHADKDYAALLGHNGEVR